MHGFQISDLGFQILDLGFQISDLGFGISDFMGPTASNLKSEI
jgi:hypothetical protein